MKRAEGGLKRCNQVTLLHERHKNTPSINLWLTEMAVFDQFQALNQSRDIESPATQP